MTDTTILRIIQESCELFSGVPGQMCSHLAPSYNALLAAALANHPDDPFLSALRPIDFERAGGHVECEELRIMLVQLRIALEALDAEQDGAGRSPHPERSAYYRAPS
jgi:hypothetical protein